MSQGFVPMVAAIRPPTSLDHSDLVEVWLALPPGALLTVDESSAQKPPSLRVPTGARVDRIELLHTEAGTHVVDVRGTEFRPEGEQFHVLEPTERDRLQGVAWLRGDHDAEAGADAALRALLERTDVPQGQIDRLVALNRCEVCHFSKKPESALAGAEGLPNRPTDASGLYGLLAVLLDESAVETSRPVDTNLEDPFIRFSCPDDTEEPEQVGAHGGPRTIRCRNGRPATGHLDVERALDAGDAHANAVCASRRYLFDHMDVSAKRAFATNFSKCHINTKGTLQ